ncbi:MAG: 2-oxoacid:acceptor oxidoreductase family protein [Kosmotogaceae bacterium]|nr:2-oxoacid:acceptor oxidoreductase family protein [Kosmotogaceae bacterium]
MKRFDIYIIGVGGQGIGLLSETLLRAVDHSGQRAIGADTHGLAQRGGMVSSHLRIGNDVHSVLIMKHSAELVIALERHEALRGMVNYLREGGTLAYYDTVWQPLEVRLRRAKEVKKDDIEREARNRNSKVLSVLKEDLKDPRMQNVVLMGTIAHNNLIPGVSVEHYERALSDLLGGELLEENLELFRSVLKQE